MNADSASVYSTVNVSGTATFDPSTTLQVTVVGSSLNVGDQLMILTASSLSWSGAPASVTAINNPAYTFSVAVVNGNSIVLTVTSAPALTNLDVTGGVVTFQAAGSAADTVNVSIVNTTYTGNQNCYLITDPAESISLSANAIAAGWTLTDANGIANANDALGPVSGISSLFLGTSGGADIVSGIAAGAADVSISGSGTLDIMGTITTTGNVSFSTYSSISDDGGDAITATTVNLAASGGIGTLASPILTDASTVTVTAGSADAFVTQATGSVSFTATASGGTNINLSDSDPAGTLTIGGATSSVNGTINLTAAGNITTNAGLTTTSGNIVMGASAAINDNANINAGSGTITISADTAGTGVAGNADFTEASTGATISSTNAGNPVTITVNTSSGGTSNASIRAISATHGVLSISTFGGSILYAGTDTLDAQQSATSALAPGINGPVASSTGQGSGAAPAGTINALTYNLSTSSTGSGSIGTAARPIETTAPSSNAISLAAGSGGAYFVDWGAPLFLNGATATGAGNVEVVAANASGHDLNVQGNVATGSGNIVLAADDKLIVSPSVIIGGAGDPLGETFSGDVYLGSNRDAGNSNTCTISGTVTTANTSASAVVIEGFHAQDNGTNGGSVTVNSVNTGDGGTITISGVPASLPTGQDSILATSASSVLNAGPTGTVRLIATTMNGNTSVTTAIGTATQPITVTAGNVIITANAGAGTSTMEPDHVYVTDTIGGNFTATTGSTSPSGSINLITTSGALTVAGATSTANNAVINLTGAGGIDVNAPLGSTTSGAIALNAGGSSVQFTSPNTLYANDPLTVTAGSAAEITSSATITLSGGTLNSASGVEVDNGGTVTGTGSVNTGSNQLTVDGTLAPTISVNGLNTDLTLNADATMQVSLAGTGAGQFSQVNVAGPVSLGSPTLVINVTGPLAAGNSFEIINAPSGSFTGSFGNSSFTAANLPGYTFSVTYNATNVVLTVTGVPTTDSFDVQGGTGSFFGAPSDNNDMTVAQSGGGVYTITDASAPIVLSTDAANAGWTNLNSHEITGPDSYVSGGNTINIANLSFNTADGSDEFQSLAAGAATVSVTGTGSLAIDGAVTTSGSANFSGYASLNFGANVTATGSITVAGVATITDDPGTLTGASLNLTASNGIGTAADPVLTHSPTITVSAGAGGAYLSQSAGSVSFTGSATGSGNLNLVDSDSTVTVSIAGATSTASGNVTIMAAGAIAGNANINAGSGTITIDANDIGSGSAGYTQAAAATLTTTNATASAVTINVNTLGGGTGTATVGNATVGSLAGGYYNVNAFGGTIVWNETAVQARGTSGVPTNVINAYGFSFSDSSTGPGGVGTSTVPMQLTGLIENDPFSASAGSGGIYVTDFSGNDLQVNQAIAAGAGSINIETANAGGHDLLINGTVTTGSGNITLYADDDLVLNGIGSSPYDGATIGTVANAIVGGSGFSGTVDIEANLDTANANPVIMDAGSSVYTTNAGATAVLIESYSAASGIGNQNTPAGGVQLGNVTVGAGGTITVNAAAGSVAARQGSIVQLPLTLLDTSGGSGTTYGTVVLTALADDTNGDGNASAAAVSGGIGVGGLVADPALFPILVKASTVIATTTGTNLANTGDIAISDDVPGSFTATTTGNTASFIMLTTTNGAALTIGGATSTAGGPITLTGAGGVSLDAALGSASTGAIAINGPLSGNGSILLGTGGLTLTQNSNSSYSGAISGGSSDSVTYAGTGVLTLGNTSTYLGATAVTGGTLTVNGTLSETSGVTVSGDGVLAGSGTISASVTDNGVVSPGGGNGGTATLAVGGLSIGTAGAFTADIAGSTAGTYDALNATGTGAFTLGGTLNIFVNPGASLLANDPFTILNDANGISGTFSNVANGSFLAAANNPNYIFTVTYNSSTVILTLTQIVTGPEVYVLNGNEVVYTTPSGMNSVLTVSTSPTAFTIEDTGTSAITLGPGTAGWSGGGTDTVSGPIGGIASLWVGLNDGNDSITSFNAGPTNATIIGTGTLTINGTTTTTGTLAIEDFAAISNDAAVSATAGITISSPGSLTLNGADSFASISGNIVVNSDLSIGSGLIFSAVAGTVTFNANGDAMTLGSETVTHGALVIENASTLTLNGLLTDGNSSITVTNVTDIVGGGAENIVAPTLSLTASDSIGSAADYLVSTAANIVASAGPGGVYITQDGSANYTVNTSLGGPVSVTDPNAADTLTITGSTATGLGGIIALAAAGNIVDNANINAGFGSVTIDADTAGSGGAGFSQTGGLITSANWAPGAVDITVNTAMGGTGNASIDNISAVNGGLSVSTYGGSILYAGMSALTSYQVGVSGDGGAAPARTISAESYGFTTANGAGAAGSVGTAARPLQLNSPATATFTASAGSGGVYAVDWAVVGAGGTLTLAGATATGSGGVLVVAANASGHDLTVTGPVTTGSGSIELAADDNFILSAPVGGAGFSGTVYLGANRDTGNTGTFTMSAGTTFNTSGSITTSSTSVYNAATLTPGAVLLEDYSASGTAAGDLVLGNITVGTGGSITATTIPNLGVYNPAVSAGACDIIAGSANVVLTAPGGTVNLFAAPGRATTAGAGIGNAASPIVVSAANVVLSSSTATTVANDSIYVTDQVAGSFSAVASGAAAGVINLTDSGGTLTIDGATYTSDGGAITLTSTVAGGGITVSAPLGAGPSNSLAGSGAIAVNAGTNSVLFSTSPQTFYSNDPITITAGAPVEIAPGVTVTLNNGSWTSASGTQVDDGATLAGSGNIDQGNVLPTVAVQAGGTLNPGDPVGTLSVSNVTLAPTSNVNVTLDSTAVGNFSQINYTTSASLNGAKLQVYVNGNLNVNDSFTIVSTSGGTLSGVFGSGASTITAINNPFYVFSVSYAGDEVTLTVTSVPTSDVVDVQGNTVDFYTLSGIANNLTVGHTGSNYSITDSAETIALTTAAEQAGWTGSGTHTVTGPASYLDNENTVNLANFAFYTQDASDTVNSMALGNANVTITGNGTGTLDFAGNVTTTGNMTLSGYTSITDGAGVLTCDALSMNAPNGIGNPSNPILTAAQSDTATATNGAIYITQTGTGAVSATAAAAITVADTSGTLTVAATTTDQTSTDAVTLTSADSLVLDGDINAGAALINISADTDGAAAAGAAGYDQAGFSLITANTGDVLYGFPTDAAVITVNTPTGGLGDAVIGMGSIGSNAGGEITINSYGGNILWSNDSIYAAFTDSQTGLANGGSNTQTLKANDYVLESLTAGTGSIGTNARPLQLDAFAPAKGLNDSDMALTAGSGGIYVTEWGTDTNDAITLDSATATGAGNIRVVAANAGTHDMYVDGPVATGTGSISLYSDDDLILTTSLLTNTPALIGGTDLLGETFSGPVDLQANRDLGNEQILDMGVNTSIVTTNSSANAVSLLNNSATGSADSPGDPLIPAGGIVLTSISTGGGGITVAANNASGAGLIVQRSGGLLQGNVVTLVADGTGTNTITGQVNTILSTTTSSSVPYAVSGSAIDLSAASLNVTEGPGFNPAPDAAFDILVNGTGQPIAAPFSNYSEGQIFSLGSDFFQITYHGGVSGQDVVLTFLGPVITTQPTNQTVAAGTTATFTAAAFGATSTPTAQWFVNMNNGNGFQQINGATSPTLTLNNVSTAMSGYEYEAIFTNSYGSAATNAATLTVSQATMTTVASNPVGPITLGTPVDFTATIANANPGNVGTVSFYFDYGQPDQIVISSAVPVTGGSATSAYTSALPAGSDLITAIYSGGAGFAGSTGTLTLQVNSAEPPPSIASVVINENLSALYNAAGQPAPGTQRSMVNDIVYTFSEAVNIVSSATDPNVFTIAVAAGWTGTLPTLSWAPVAGSGNTEWAVSFSGASVSASSIANGAYTITVNHPSAITAVSDSQDLSLAGSGIGGAAQSFYRLFGDINGDEFVNAADNLKFKLALTTYNAAFDFNGDGVVNAADNLKFKNNLTVNFSGFTPTI